MSRRGDGKRAGDSRCLCCSPCVPSLSHPSEAPHPLWGGATPSSKNALLRGCTKWRWRRWIQEGVDPKTFPGYPTRSATPLFPARSPSLLCETTCLTHFLPSFLPSDHLHHPTALSRRCPVHLHPLLYLVLWPNLPRSLYSHPLRRTFHLLPVSPIGLPPHPTLPM